MKKFRWLPTSLVIIFSILFASACDSFPAPHQSTSAVVATDESGETIVSEEGADPSEEELTVEPSPEPTEPEPTAGQAGITDQDPRELALAFIERSYAFHGLQLPSDALDPYSMSFSNVMYWRRSLIMERRELFGNQQELIDVQVENEHFTMDGDRAFLMVRTLETFEYEEEPGVPGMARSVYLVLLREVDGAWRISWASDGNSLMRLAQGDGESEETAPARNFFRYGGINIPFVYSSSLSSIDYLDLSEYADIDIFARVEDYPYADLSFIAANERSYMEEEQAALAEQLGQIPFAESSGLYAFDREAMGAYIERWALERNSEWADFSPYGGDCQNFASQVLRTGGAPMVDGWYFHSFDDRVPSWGSVPWMTDFITENEGMGPQADKVDSWTELSVGDMIHIDWTQDGGGDHATVVCSTGEKARLAGHSTDAICQRVSDAMGHKILLHLTGYDN